MRWRKLAHPGGTAALLVTLVVGCERSTHDAATRVPDKEEVISIVLRQLNVISAPVLVSGAALDSVVGLSPDQIGKVRSEVLSHVSIAEPSECTTRCLAVQIAAYSTSGDTARVLVRTWGVLAGGAQNWRTDSTDEVYTFIARDPDLEFVGRRVLSVGVSAPPQ